MPLIRRALRFTAVVLAVGVVGVLASISAARSLVLEDPLRPADIVIALAGDPSSTREMRAADLYRTGYARRVVVGGVPFGDCLHSGEAARRVVTAQAVPVGDIFILPETWNTRREGAELRDLMHAHGWRSAIVVTSRSHSRRALFTLRRAAPEVQFVSAPLAAGADSWRPEQWWKRRGHAEQTLREWLAWINTVIGGFS